MAVDPATRAYFSPPPSAVWRWSDDGDGLEDLNGRSIVFRAELLQYLKRLQPQGLPPFDSLVLVLKSFRSWNVTDTNPRACRDVKVSLHEQELLTALQRVSDLPSHVQTRVGSREAIVALVFLKRSDICVSPTEAVLLIERFAAGIPADELLEPISAALPMAVRIKQWRTLTDGLGRVSADSVRNLTRTGLEQLPAKETVGNILAGLLEAKAAEQEEPESTPKLVQELLEELKQDDQYLTFVKLVRNLLAMVHLPKSLEQEEELPLGGVSDITNRGPLDRLLLSELAYDDATLTTRVALNEALYLRRETPPSNPRQQRVVLLDCSLRMWGVPRVYGTAVALALLATQQRTSSSQKSAGESSLSFWRAAGRRLLPVDFSTQEGLLEQLEALQPELHFAEALPELARQAGSPEVERVFITCAETWQDAVLQTALREHDLRECYVFLVSRDGRLELRRVTAAGSKTLRTVQQSLAGLLERPAQTSKPEPLVRSDVGTRLPAFYLADPCPLRIPEPIDWARSWYWEGIGNFSLTPHGELLWWAESSFGPQLIASGLPPGVICWTSHYRQGDPYGYVALHDTAGKLDTVLSLATVNFIWSVKTLFTRQATSVATEYCDNHDLILAIHPGATREVAVYLKSNGAQLAKWTLPENAQVLGRYLWRESERKLFALGSGTRLEEVPLPEDFRQKLSYQNGIIIRAVLEGATGPVIIANNGLYVAEGTSKTVGFKARWVNVSQDRQRVLLGDGFAAVGQFALFTTGKDMPEVINNQMQARLRLHQPGWVCASPREMITTVSGVRIAHGRLHLVKRLRQVQSIELRTDLSLRKAKTAPATQFRFEPAAVPPEHGYRNLKWVRWSDGSTIWLDPRGLLHLQSSQRQIPEVTIVLSTDEYTSGWCSDGDVWGAFYFLGPNSKPMARETIYKEVIEPFLKRLPQK